jgi:hypothetical protein
VKEHAEDAIRLQIEILDWRLAGKKADRIEDPAAWLVSAIKRPHTPPKGFEPRAERQAREEAKQARERKAAEDRRREQAEATREKTERQAIEAYWSALTPEQQAELDAAATAQADPVEVSQEWGPLKKLGQRLRRDQSIRQLLASRETRPAEA